MELETLQCLAKLEVITQPLYFPSAGDEPLVSFVWAKERSKNWSFHNMLRMFELLHIIDTEQLIAGWHGKAKKYFKPPDIKANCQKIIDLFHKNLIEMRTYEFRSYEGAFGGLGKDGIMGYDCFQFITGKVQDNHWLGLTPVYRYIGKYEYGETLDLRKKTSSQFLTQLKSRLDPDLEQLHPVIINYEPTISERIAWAEGTTEDEVVERLFLEAQMSLVWKFHGFSDVLEEEGFRTFDKFIDQYIQNPRLYMVGNWSVFRLYLVGQIANGDWIIVLTSAF